MINPATARKGVKYVITIADLHVPRGRYDTALFSEPVFRKISLPLSKFLVFGSLFGSVVGSVRCGSS